MQTHFITALSQNRHVFVPLVVTIHNSEHHFIEWVTVCRAKLRIKGA